MNISLRPRRGFIQVNQQIKSKVNIDKDKFSKQSKRLVNAVVKSLNIKNGRGIQLVFIKCFQKDILYTP